MSNPVIKIKRSGVAGKVPTVSQLPLGEFAINFHDGKVFIAKNAGVGTEIVEVGISTQSVLSGIITTTDLQVTNTISGVSSGSQKVSVVTDNGNQWHNVPFLDSATGYQTLKSNGLTYNPYIGKLSAGIGSFNSITGNLTGNITGDLTGNIYSTGISTISGFTFPSSDGVEGQVLTTDGSGNLQFKTIVSSSGAGTSIADQSFTASEGQTVFTSSHSFANNSIQVFVNGLKLRSQTDYTISGSKTLTLSSGLRSQDKLNLIVCYGYDLDEEYFTSTEGQTSFTLTGEFAQSKNIKVYVNGVKLRRTIDYGTSVVITLNSAASSGDEIDLVSETDEDYITATEGQTVFVPSSDALTEDNTQVFLNGVKLENSIDYTLGSPSVTLANSLTAGDEVDIVITRS